MVRPEKVLAAIKKAKDYVASQQCADGSWRIEKTHKEPPFYQKPIVITSEAIQALAIFADKEKVPAISRGLNFLFREEIAEKDPIDMCSWKSLALRYSNTPVAGREIKKLSAQIASEQTRNGCWRTYPTTFNLTNHYCILALSGCGYEENLEKARKWFINARAKDKLGWGFDNLAEDSEVSFTCNVALALLSIGENPLCPELQAARKFLEDRQFRDGGWPSSKMTVATKSTTYATALALLTLMHLVENPFSPKIDAGIKFLLDSQAEEGFWPLIPGEKKFDVYPNLYVIQALSFYLFLLEKLRSPEIELLKQKLERPQYLTLYLAKEFDRHLKMKFNEAVINNITDSRVLGITPNAIERRKEILRALYETGELEPAQIIDELKKLPRYQILKKKSHLTQIKADIEYLRLMNAIYENEGRYFATHRIL
jgi:hypothetical protein